jgi:uncharacterized glyoxalase superfamily protein PhnB
VRSHSSKTHAIGGGSLGCMTVATQSIFSTFRYRDAPAAIDFLERAFGFERGDVHKGPDGTVQHAELHFAGEWIMLGTARDDAFASGPTTTYLVVDDPDAHYEQAVAAGAEIVRELNDTDYGSRDFAARDPEGNVWSFGTYRPAAP